MYVHVLGTDAQHPKRHLSGDRIPPSWMSPNLFGTPVTKTANIRVYLSNLCCVVWDPWPSQYPQYQHPRQTHFAPGGVTLSTMGTRTPLVLSAILPHTCKEGAKPSLAHNTSAHRRTRIWSRCPPRWACFLLFLPATTQLPTQPPGMHSAQRGRMVQLKPPPFNSEPNAWVSVIIKRNIRRF